MQPITLQQNERNTLNNRVLNISTLDSAKIVEPKDENESLSAKDGVLAAYQKMFGKRKKNKYTENEIFIFNSKLNAAKNFSKYL